MTARYCPICYNELWGTTCYVCHTRKIAAEQRATAVEDTNRWMGEHTKEPEFPMQYTVWGGHDGSRPRWHNEWDLDFNVMVRYINELHDRIADMEFKLEEMREELDNRSSECGLSEGRQIA